MVPPRLASSPATYGGPSLHVPVGVHGDGRVLHQVGHRRGAGAATSFMELCMSGGNSSEWCCGFILNATKHEGVSYVL
jgi:hypothetical protein